MNNPSNCFAFIASSSRFATLRAPQCSVKEVAGLEDDSEHGKLSRGLKGVLNLTKMQVGKLAHNPKWIFGRRTTRFLGVVTLFAVVVALLLGFLNWYVAPTTPSEKKDLVLALAQILAGTALLSGLYFTWRTLQVNREGQITERFTRAIDQLGKTDDEGNKRMEIRLGGIYALERIARESEEDHWPIMEVLTAYVRQHTHPRLPDAPGPDVQAIMAVIRRRISHFHNGEPEFIDLHETDLQGANLYKAHLYGADLRGANLSAANLSAANLSGADLHGANLEGANLSEAVLSGANLADAHLEGAKNLEATKGLLPDQLEEAVTDERTTLLKGSLRTVTARKPGASYKVKQGDTLWKIAKDTYNDGNEWRRIHQANAWILDPHRIQANWWIWIPPPR